MKRKIVHLVCNAHLDPVWMWRWEDGLAETLSTFRVAAEFCERNREFVFNHNESLLYEWTQEHDPALFQRIRRLVRRRQWHIAGGAYLKPDLNAPCGESHIRQYLYGKRFLNLDEIHLIDRKPCFFHRLCNGSGNGRISQGGIRCRHRKGY